MYKAKRIWLQPRADLAPLCGIAIVILLFLAFRWENTFWRPMKIEEPVISVSPQYGSPQGAFKSTVFVGRTSVVMYELFDKGIRMMTLLQMGEIYNVKFDSAEVEKFSKLPVVCVPIARMKKYLATYSYNQSFSNQPGIPVSSKNNELANWILESRKACRALYGKDLHIGIDADKTLLYPDIKNIFNTLAAQKLYHFRLITMINPLNDRIPETDDVKEDRKFLTL